MNLDIFVFRHPVSFWNIGTVKNGPIHQGQCYREPGLAPRGFLQAECLAYFLRNYPVSGIWTSPLPRALQCAKMIQALYPYLIPVHIDPDLMEISNGKLDGMSFREIAKWFPMALVRWEKKEIDAPFHPGGEFPKDVAERVANALTRIAAISARSKFYPCYNGHPVVISHGAALGLGFARLAGAPLKYFRDIFHLDNASLSVLHWDDTRRLLTVKKWNITSYLGKLKHSPEITL